MSRLRGNERWCYPRNTPPVVLVTSATIFCAERVDLGVGHGFFARLHGDGDGNRLLAGVDALALVDVEHGDADDQLLVDALRRAHDIGGLHACVHHEGEIARHRLERRQFEHAASPASAWPSARGFFRRITSKATSGPSALSAAMARGCSSPKTPKHILRPDLDGAASGRDGTRPARPARPAAPASARRQRRARRRRRALASNASTGAAGLDQWRPVPAGFGQRAAHAAGGGELILRPVAGEDLPDLEQRHVGHAAVGIALRRHDQAGHAGSAACRRVPPRSDWPAPAQRLPPPNNSASRLDDERPGDGLDHGRARRARAWPCGCGSASASARACARARRAETASTAPDRRRRCAPVPRRCRRGRARPAATTAPRPSRARSGRRRRSRASPARGARRRAAASMPASRCNSLSGKSMTVSFGVGSPATTISDGVPPHRSSTICVASSRPGSMKSGSTPRSKR